MGIKFQFICYFHFTMVLINTMAVLNSSLSGSNCVRRGNDSWHSFLPLDYNPAQVPVRIEADGRSLPVKVYCAASVRTVAPIGTAETEFRVNMRLTLKWIDNRLKTCDSSDISDFDSDKVYFPPEASKQVWLPNPYITNSKHAEIKRLAGRLMTVAVDSNGWVTFTSVINVTVACAMSFNWYPLDIQICPMHFESFSYDASLVDFQWLSTKPFEVIPKRLIQFEVSPDLVFSRTLNYRKALARNFTTITVYFKFDRLFGSHMIKTFVPCSLVVILSWFSFWLELDVTSARASLLMTAMLTLVMQFSGLRADLPQVAYVKAVDIWMFGCMLSIFAAMAEFALVKVLYAITEKIRKQNLVQSMLPSTESQELVFYPNEILYSIGVSSRPLHARQFSEETGSYKKKRLGSVVLSGRSVATSHLPKVDLHTIFGIRVPLVWTGGTTTADDENVDENTLQPRKYVLWREIDVVSRQLFPTIFFLFTSGYWIVLAVFSRLDHSYSK